MPSELRPGVFGVDPDGLRARFAEIFQDRYVFLRELLQNSLQAIRLQNPIPPTARIDIRTDRRGSWLEVADTGLGLTYTHAQSAVSRFFHSDWQASSPSRAVDDDTLESSDLTGADIGRFGIGLSTCLLVGDRYELRTRPSDGSPASLHHVYAGSMDGVPTVQYAHALADDTLLPAPGTVVRVYLRPTSAVASITRILDRDFLRTQVTTYLRLSEVPIFIDGVLTVGGDPKPPIIPHFFYDRVHTIAGSPLAQFNIRRRRRGHYLRARIAIPSTSSASGTFDVFCRGVFVGTLPSRDVLPQYLSFVSGCIDSDMFSLQLDRAQLSRDARLDQFVRNFADWLVVEFGKLATRDWATFVRVASIHRINLLWHLYVTPSATKQVGEWMPFPDAADLSQSKPLRYYMDQSLTSTDMSKRLPFSSGYTDQHHSMLAFRALDWNVPVFETYVMLMSGRTNLDYLFVTRHISNTNQSHQPVRIDVLVGELYSPSLSQPLPKQHRILHAALASRFDDLCQVNFAQMPDIPLPGIVAASRQQMRGEENPRQPDRIAKLGRVGQPTVLLNLNHPTVASSVLHSNSPHALPVLTLLIDLLLLSLRPSSVHRLLADALTNLAAVFSESRTNSSAQ